MTDDNDDDAFVGDFGPPIPDSPEGRALRSIRTVLARALEDALPHDQTVAMVLGELNASPYGFNTRTPPAGHA